MFRTSSMGSILLILLVTLTPAHAFDPTELFSWGKEHTWNLPSDLSDTNTKIEFEVDTSLHLVSGVAPGIRGKVWLEDDSFQSIKAEIKIPVQQMSTGNESRDRKMHKVMKAARFPEVIFTVSQVKNLCDPKSLDGGSQCRAELAAQIQIAGIDKALLVPVVVRKAAGNYQVSGTTTLKWRDFGIEDPSTFLAKLKETVSISFSCKLSS